jgi:CheY-like chemotaxis protein
MDRHYLIVDDNRAFAENIAEIVRDLGDDVSVADSGDKALALARRRRYHALVTDMRMPFMGGAQLVREIRKVDPELPALVVTAHVADAELEAARAEGLLAVLSKPVPIGTLLDLLGVARRHGLALVVAEDDALRDDLCLALQARGFAALTAGSVAEAARLVGLRPFVALVDLHVPGGPAGEALRLLARSFPGLPLIAMSGHPDPPPLAVAAHFPKPFRTEELLAAVERCHAPAQPQRR